MNSKKFLQAEKVIEIPFFDVDSMNVAWHGNCVKYLEEARCVLLDKIDYNYIQMSQSGYSWPVVNLNIKYIKPFVFKQKIKVTAELIEYENCLKIKYIITDNESGQKLTKAETTQVAVNMSDNDLCYATPKVAIEKINKAMQEL